MPSRRTWMIVSGVTLAIILASPFLAILAINHGYGLSYLERQAGAQLGMPVRLADLHIGFGREMTARVRDLRVGAEDGRSNAEAPLSLASGTARIPLWDLLRGRFERAHILLIEPRADLRIAEDREGNLPFLNSDDDPDAEGFGRQDLTLLSRIEVQDGQFRYADAQQDLNFAGTVTVESQSEATGQGIDIRSEGDGTVAGKPFDFDIRLPPSEDSARPPAIVSVRLGATRIDAKGGVPFDGLEGAPFELRLEGRNLAELAPYLSLPLPDTPPYTLQGSLVVRNDIWTVDLRDGQVGQSDLKGRVAVDVNGEKPFIDADLTSDLLDLADFAEVLGLPGTRPAAEETGQEETREAAAPPRILPNAKLDVARLALGDADLNLQANEVRNPYLEISKLTLGLTLRGKVLKIDPLELTAPKGLLSATATIDGTSTPPQSNIVARLRNFELANQFPPIANGTEPALQGPLQARLHVEGPGASIRELLQLGSGALTASLGSGRIDPLAVEALGVDFGQALGQLGDEDRHSIAIHCIVARLALEGGTARATALIMDTPDSRIDGEGSIDLAQEEMDLRLISHPKDVSIGAARTPITVTGPLAHPSIGVAPEGLIARGGAALALGVLLTPLAAILPFTEWGLEEENGCATAEQ